MLRILAKAWWILAKVAQDYLPAKQVNQNKVQKVKVDVEDAKKGVQIGLNTQAMETVERSKAPWRSNG